MTSTAVLLAIVLTAADRTAAPPDENAHCGGHCLYVALRALDVEIGTYDELEGRLGPPGLEGYSLGKLEEVARSYGVQTLGVLTSFENLRRRKGRFACIAHLENPPHFVNLADVEERGSVFVIDPHALEGQGAPAVDEPARA
jgi:ABC-type bacteriocin/lantibiotic exporter with double-glycine peptidase domain